MPALLIFSVFVSFTLIGSSSAANVTLDNQFGQLGFSSASEEVRVVV